MYGKDHPLEIERRDRVNRSKIAARVAAQLAARERARRHAALEAEVDYLLARARSLREYGHRFHARVGHSPEHDEAWRRRLYAPK